MADFLIKVANLKNNSNILGRSGRYDQRVLVEGIGRHVVNNVVQDGIYHHAYAVISYDDRAGKYRWQAWRIPRGIYTEYSSEICYVI